jgi:hypothetical protein
MQLACEAPDVVNVQFVWRNTGRAFQQCIQVPAIVLERVPAQPAFVRKVLDVLLQQLP